MYLRRLTLEHFRCYARLDLTLPCETVVIAGPNAQGKTSLLEAAYLLATTRAPYSVPDRQLIRWAALEEEVLPFARVRGEIAMASGSRTIEILTLRQPGEGREQVTKRARVDEVPRRAMDVLGQLNVVLFTPRDVEIVAGGPVERRRYLDGLLCQVDRHYCRTLARYNRILGQRNHLLRGLRDRRGERGGQREELAVWDTRLAEDGAHLLLRRHALLARLEPIVSEIHASLAGEPLVTRYHDSLSEAEPTPSPEDRQPDTGDPLPPGVAPVSATAPSAKEQSARFEAVLRARHDEEIRRGQTAVGPHRDDLSFTVNDVDMRSYGSRGQQRTVTLALKLAEARLMWTLTGERPVLLLDDVLGELDGQRRAQLLAHIDGRQQVLVTTTDADTLPPDFAGDALVLHVLDGAIQRATRGGVAVTVPTHDGSSPEAVPAG